MNDQESTNTPERMAISPLRHSLDSPPPSVAVGVDFGARSQRGPLHSVNDDHYLVLRLGRHQETLLTSLPEGELTKRFDEYGYGMVIADGMGRAGEASSRLAIETLVHLAVYFGRWHVRVDEPTAEEMMDRAARFYRSIDLALLEASHNNPRGLQTTMTTVYTAGADLFFAHVGHSRAYLFRDDRLLQLTYDHTVNRVHPGTPTIVDVAAHLRDLQHIVTQTLGASGQRGSSIDVERFGLLDDDVVLLCTNGLTDVARDSQIADVLRSHSAPDEACQALVDLATNAGAEDDVTVVAAHYRIPARV